MISESPLVVEEPLVVALCEEECPSIDRPPANPAAPSALLAGDLSATMRSSCRRWHLPSLKLGFC